jgi:hypothetical protein
MIGRFSSISGSSRQWGEALARMDKSRRLTLAESNRLLDTIVVTQDAERALVAHALRCRLEARERSAR